MKYLITHTDLDGYGSAVLEKIFHEELGFDDVFPRQYNFEKFSHTINDLVKEGNEFVIADLSIPEETYEKWNSILDSLIILDHHDTAEYLSSKKNSRLDLKRCGTRIFWEDYVVPRIYNRIDLNSFNCVSMFVRLVDTYDMWRKESPYWNEALKLNELWAKYKEDFIEKMAIKLFTLMDKDWEWSEEENKIYADAVAEENSVFENAVKSIVVKTDNKGFVFGVFLVENRTKSSIICSRVLEELMDLDYLICYSKNLRGWSLRSREYIDLTKLHGVNGHKNACGVVTKTNKITKQLLEPDTCLKWVEEGEEKQDSPIVEKIEKTS